VLAVAPVVQRELRRHVSDPVLLEDLCQEVMARLVAAAGRLDTSTMAAYARVVARNVVSNHRRDERNLDRKLARAAVMAPRSAEGADEQADLGRAEEAAVRTALERLSASDRELLEAPATDHSADGADEASSEGSSGGSSEKRRAAARDGAPAAGTLRVRQHRARARARVRYLLALRGATPASDRCLPVLDALSAGDRARQRAVGVESHLAGCPLCASLAEDVVRRERPLPVLILLAGAAALWRALRQHPVASAAGASAVVAAGLAVASAGGGPPTAFPPASLPTSTGAGATTAPAPPPPASPLRTADRALLPLPPDLTALAGSAVRADSVPVRRVVGDEALWVGTSDQDQLLVVLIDPVESPQQVADGQRLDFTGRVVANPPDPAALAAALGVEPSEGLDVLLRQGVHLEVSHADLVVR
jgi:RNA polymerase sigma factor (sigma-70 family)